MQPMDEVPGKKLQADASGLDTTYCQPCSQDGENLPVEAYCTVCKEFLCSTCTKAHRKLKMSKGHTIQDKSSMPDSITSQENESQDIEICEKHVSEPIKYFCTEHQVCICGHCLALEHRNCEVEIIAVISSVFKESQEYDDLKADIAQLLEEIDICSTDAKSNINVAKKLAESELLKLGTYREEVIKRLAEREKELINIIEDRRTADEILMRSFQTKCENLKSDVKDVTDKLRSQEKCSVRLFIASKRVEPLVDDLQSALNEIRKDNEVHPYKFEKDPDTEMIFSSETGLGSIEDINFKMKIQMLQECEGQAQVKSPSDTHDCFMANMLLVPGDRLLLADSKNSTVKLVDLQTNSLVSQVSMPGQPWGMCLLPRNMVAICVVNQCKIQFLKLGKQIHESLRDIINVDGRCYGIGYHNQRLIVGYTDGKLEKMDLRGNVIKKLNQSNQVNSHSTIFYSLAVVSECETAAIYVSNSKINTITKLDMDLNVLQTFKDTALIEPRGITAVGNQLIICGRNSDNIMCLDMPSGQMCQVLGKTEGIQKPICVCYSQQQNKLYVIIGSNPCALKVYKAFLFEDA